MSDKNNKEPVVKKAVTKTSYEPRFTAEELKSSSAFTRVEKDFLDAYIKAPATVKEARDNLDKKMKESVK